MKLYILLYSLIAAVLLLSACRTEARDEHHSHDHDHGHGHSHSHDHDHDHSHDNDLEDSNHDPDEIIFTRAQAEAAGLQVETIVPGLFTSVIKTGGQIQAARGDEATIAATASGIVSFANPSIAEGLYVAPGETILTISAGNLPDGDPAIKAKITYETALSEMARADELVRNRIISVKEHEQIRLRYETARTVYEAQRADVTSSGIRISSPKGGYIGKLAAGHGEYVAVGQTIATVSQNRRLQLRAEVSERYFGVLKNIGSANFKTAYDNRLHKLSDMGGRIISFGKTAPGGESCFIPMVFEFDGRDDIIPGTFVEAYLLSVPQDNVITVPLSAVTEEQGLQFVYIRVDDEGYRKKEIKLGYDNGERASVLSGLNPGETVVVDGVYQVKLAAIASIVPEGHAH